MYFKYPLPALYSRNISYMQQYIYNECDDLTVVASFKNNKCPQRMYVLIRVSRTLYTITEHRHRSDCWEHRFCTIKKRRLRYAQREGYKREGEKCQNNKCALCADAHIHFKAHLSWSTKISLANIYFMFFAHFHVHFPLNACTYKYT